MPAAPSLEELETTLLFEAIFQRFGDDFRNHLKKNMTAKLHRFMQTHSIATISALQNRVLHDPSYIDALLCALDAQTTSLFDHPQHLLELRKTIVPWFRSCPAPKIWIAECASAEDVFALAILLQEEGLSNKTRIFATSANATLLNESREGRFAIEKLAAYGKNYQLAGGTQSLADYYEQVDGSAVFHSQLSRKITWAQYSLATDASFNEFELIICRGGLSDYTSRLRKRAMQVFSDSLPMFGFLSLLDTDFDEVAGLVTGYKAILAKQGLYQRVR